MIEAEDRKAALQFSASAGCFLRNLELSAGNGAAAAAKPLRRRKRVCGDSVWGQRVSRKDITAFTREMSALLGAAIPIPQALDGLGEEEENPALAGGGFENCGLGAERRVLFHRVEEHP